MTKRVRFTPLLCAGLFCAGALAARPAGATDQPLVAQPPIAAGINLKDAAAADIDGDGDVDLVAVGLNGVYWFQNVAGTFTQRTILTASSQYTVALADLDGDGDVDIVNAALAAQAVLWHENAAGDGSVWTTHTLATPFAFEGQLVDVDRDGDLDALATWIGMFAWLENTGTPAWTVHTVMTTATAGESAGRMVAADLDGDGDLDIAATTAGNYGLDTRLFWAENTAGNGTAWTRRTIPFFQLYGARGSLSSTDIDGDGNADLVLGTTNVIFGYSGPNVRWFENVLGNGTAWTLRTIGGAPANAATPRPADFDGDGDVDVMCAFGQVQGAGGNDLTAWFENTGGGLGWTRRTISTVSVPSSVVSVDLDRDGDNDVVLPSYLADRLDWFRNDTIHRSARFPPAAAISTTSAGALTVAVADVDKDGAPDVVAASLDDDTVRWHENVAGNGSSWTPHTVSTAVDGAISVAVADVDRDGDADVLSAALNGDRIDWHQNAGGGGTAWNLRTIATGVDAPVALSAADVDGDGDLDAMSAAYYGGIRWFRNLAGNGSTWSATTILGGSLLTATPGDVDRDGDLDVMSSTAFFDVNVRWNANVGGDGSAWSPHTVATLAPSPSYGSAVADMDKDGDPDLVATALGAGGSGLRWFENLDATGSSWSTRTIATNDAIQVALGDLDRDGDVDAVATGVGDLAVVWYENAGGTWSEHDLATAADISWGVAVADLDRDGDLDIVSATPGANRVDWFADCGGQFALSVADVAPPGGDNGTEVAMLRIDVTHLGRAGDGSLELASLGLRLEEGPGDPLTSAEANAIIENLHFYLDANGSGVFEPATDVRAATVATLALSDGVQTVTLPDGDPNLQVDFGTPRTYFVVAELTGTANQQTPHAFRVTLLGQGSSASRAEDRAYDIPLAPACPADVASSVMGATPVMLMRFEVE